MQRRQACDQMQRRRKPSIAWQPFARRHDACRTRERNIVAPYAMREGETPTAFEQARCRETPGAQCTDGIGIRKKSGKYEHEFTHIAYVIEA